MWCRDRGEIALYTTLYSQARPVEVDLENARLVMIMDQAVRSDWVVTLRGYLQDWTKQEWSLDVQPAGEGITLPTVHDDDTRAHETLRASLENHPEMQKIIDIWPDISMIDVKQSSGT